MGVPIFPYEHSQFPKSEALTFSFTPLFTVAMGLLVRGLVVASLAGATSASVIVVDDKPMPAFTGEQPEWGLFTGELADRLDRDAEKASLDALAAGRPEPGPGMADVVFETAGTVRGNTTGRADPYEGGYSSIGFHF